MAGRDGGKSCTAAAPEGCRRDATITSERQWSCRTAIYARCGNWSAEAWRLGSRISPAAATRPAIAAPRPAPRRRRRHHRPTGRRLASPGCSVANRCRPARGAAAAAGAPPWPCLPSLQAACDQTLGSGQCRPAQASAQQLRPSPAGMLGLATRETLLHPAPAGQSWAVQGASLPITASRPLRPLATQRARFAQHPGPSPSGPLRASPLCSAMTCSLRAWSSSSSGRSSSTKVRSKRDIMAGDRRRFS
jgi:hypothetical protein